MNIEKTDQEDVSPIIEYSRHVLRDRRVHTVRIYDSGLVEACDSESDGTVINVVETDIANPRDYFKRLESPQGVREFEDEYAPSRGMCFDGVHEELVVRFYNGGKPSNKHVKFLNAHPSLEVRDILQEISVLL